MRFLMVILVLISLISCEKINLSDINNIDDINNINNPVRIALQGEFGGCYPSVEYPGSFSKTSFIIDGLNVEMSFASHHNSDCSDLSGPTREKYKIVEAVFDPNNPNIIDVDLKMISYEFSPDHPWYVAQNYCGHTDWASGVFKDITGDHCPGFTNSPYTDYIRAKDDIYYTRYEISLTELKIPLGYAESGFSASDRHVSDLTAIPRIN